MQANVFDEVPIVDADAYLNKVEGKWENECKKVADSLHNYGIIIFKDPRAKDSDNETYLDMMERYFNKASKDYYNGRTLKDARPELFYQTGVTPELKEKARNHVKLVDSLTGENAPLSQFPPEWDAKWRFFWQFGPRPEGREDPFPRVVPDDFPDWEEKMNTWGGTLLSASEVAAEMAAIGMGLDKDTFTSRMKLGPHLLGPTGSDLKKWDVGTTFAGFHYDLNFLTIHGKSRYPGLFIWLRDWRKAAVKIPAGCILMQAGAMFEHITGGYVLSGYHEVIYTEQTKAALEKVE